MKMLFWILIVAVAIERGTAMPATEETPMEEMTEATIEIASDTVEVAEKPITEETPEIDNVLFQSFTAASGPTTIESEKMLTFESASVNVGEGYDAESSTFVCPINGYYEFRFVISGIKGTMAASIMRDNEVVSPLAFTASNGEISTETIVLCKESQKIYVQVQFGNGLMLNNVNGMDLSGFSGKLIAAA